MKKILIILALIIILVLTNGCNILEVPESKQPYLKEISISPEKIEQGEEFKLFVTIKNPTVIEFKPYLLLNFDKTKFSSYYYYNDKRIVLEPIQSGGEKSYLLRFKAESDAETGSTSMTLFIFGEEDAKQSLSYKKKEIVIVSSVR